MNDPIEKSGELRPGTPRQPTVRIVLAEADAPGPLHYLLESEGFLIVGCASDEEELARMLAQGPAPDVVVFDTEISVTSVPVALELAPSAHVIVIWPAGVQPLPDTERVDPRLVYERLGPAIRRAVRERPPQHATSDPPSQELRTVSDDARALVAAAASPGVGASRVWIAPLVLVAVLTLTVGAAVASQGWPVRLPWAAPRIGPVARETPGPSAPKASPVADRAQHHANATMTGSCPPTGNDGVRKSRNEHATGTADTAHARTCHTRGGSGSKRGHHGKTDQPGNTTHHPGKKPSGVGPDPSHGSNAAQSHASNTHSGPPSQEPQPQGSSHGDSDHHPG